MAPSSGYLLNGVLIVLCIMEIVNGYNNQGRLSLFIPLIMRLHCLHHGGQIICNQLHFAMNPMPRMMKIGS